MSPRSVWRTLLVVNIALISHPIFTNQDIISAGLGVWWDRRIVQKSLDVTKQASTNSRKLKSYQSLSDHKGLKLETNLKEKTQKHSYSWRLNSMLLKNGSRMRLGKKSKRFWKQMKMNSQQPKTYGTQHRQS